MATAYTHSHMKTILLPLNLDANTLALFKYAQPMAAKLNASLVLLHVVKTQSYDTRRISPKTEVHAQIAQEAKVVLEHMSRRALVDGIRSKVIVLSGDPAEVILNTARAGKVDMILLGGSRETKVTSQILAEAPCAVLNVMGNGAGVAVEAASTTAVDEDTLQELTLAAA
jgi:nucleotide-binding universal stress UspA family protein